MKQQLNLYVKTVPVRIPFSARTCLLLMLAAITLVMLLTLVEAAGLSDLRQQVAELKQQQREFESKTEALLQQQQATAASVALRQLHDQLQQALADQQRLAELLVQHAPMRRGIFSPLLAGLSEQALNGVSLSRIQATQAGAQISLQGHARKAELIPQYLQRLGQAPAYENARFDQFELSDAGSGLQFRVSGRHGGGDA